MHPLYKNIKDSILNNFLKGGGAYQIEEGVSNREGGGHSGLTGGHGHFFYFTKLFHFI